MHVTFYITNKCNKNNQKFVRQRLNENFYRVRGYFVGVGRIVFACTWITYWDQFAENNLGCLVLLELTSIYVINVLSIFI